MLTDMITDKNTTAFAKPQATHKTQIAKEEDKFTNSIDKHTI
jgi:hypothetical protein